MIYALNETCSVVVNTPFGQTGIIQIDNLVKQGTALGPVLCSASIGDYASVNSKHQHPPWATPRVLHSAAAPGLGFILDDLPRGPGFCISIKLRLVQ